MAQSFLARVFSVLGVAGMVWIGWLVLMIHEDAWHLFRDNWFMSVTMAFGSFIAGATSEGGGAVAFPTMTLIFGIEPHVARDFSLMIQSVGMTAAALTVVFTRIPIEWRAVAYGSMGGALGMLVGLEVLAPRLPPPYAKMFFTAVWASFALALYWMNRQHGRLVLDRISHFRGVHAWLLAIVGFIGGCVSAITGSGLDILTFSLLVLAFRVDEKIATPTSVILMGLNAVIGFTWKQSFAAQPLAVQAWDYWYVCVPIVVVGAPLGVRFIANRSRLFVAGFLYLSISTQFLAALLIVPQTASLLAFSAITLLCGGALFHSMSRYGERRLEYFDKHPVNRAAIGCSSPATTREAIST